MKKPIPSGRWGADSSSFRPFPLGTTHGTDPVPLPANPQNHTTMLRWVLTFLVIALIAALFGFTGIAAGAASIAKVIFFIFVALLVLSLLFGSWIWKKVD